MSYSDVHRHHTMVFDERRNTAYLRAMAKVITPDSVVLDLGAGLGVLGLLAAKLGARKVYCVEPSAVAAHIAELAAANGVADRIEVLRGGIEDVELPEQVDVLLSVFTGNLLFTESLLPFLYYARDRYLKPDGVMIPDRARLCFAAVEYADGHAETAGVYNRTSLGIDWSPVGSVAANGVFMMDRDKTAPALISSKQLATEIDLRNTSDDVIKWRSQTEALRDGIVHGMSGWIEIALGGQWLSTAPDAPAVHWRPALLPLTDPVAVQKGQTLELAFQFVDDAQMFWSVGVNGARQRQATVLASTDAAIAVMLSSPACNNALGPDGLLVERVLAGMREGRSNQAIADEVIAAMPQHFRDHRAALKRVGALAARYRSHPLRKA